MKCKRCQQEFDDIPQETGLCFLCFFDSKYEPQVGDIVEVIVDGRQSESSHGFCKGVKAKIVHINNNNPDHGYRVARLENIDNRYDDWNLFFFEFRKVIQGGD